MILIFIYLYAHSVAKVFIFHIFEKSFILIFEMNIFTHTRNDLSFRKKISLLVRMKSIFKIFTTFFPSLRPFYIPLKISFTIGYSNILYINISILTFKYISILYLKKKTELK